MMGQAGRDPIFYATLAIANQDVDFGGESAFAATPPARGWTDAPLRPTARRSTRSSVTSMG